MAKERAAEAGGTIRVAVVEDDDKLRQTLEAFINRSGGMRFAADDVDWLYVGGSPASYYRVLRVR